ncbi:hypothetical protein MINTMi27_14940 [Mycobacterium intracellulare]|uniref:SPFH domain-containing protein n=1 Tax=Mycobacterium intracellulare TaxID=1767 RepID=UPI001926EE53|nr:SPFH domain-containing protein [Mycobacterium intracellulare]BCP41401.1 hypothetical protein MINTMi27_14940 [Mycobacterium intracellulare]
MGTTIFLVVLLLLALGVGLGSFFSPTRELRFGLRAGSGVLAGIFVLSFIFSVFTVVSTRNVGIVTTMGRPNGELSNGLHMIAPWQDVTEMDGAIQLQKFEGDKAMHVRLGNNSTAAANVTIQWRLDPHSAPSLFLDYRTFGNIEENLVDKELGVAMNSEMAKFDPLAPGAADGAPLVQISEKVQHDVQAAVGNRIEVQKVFVPLLTYDQQTQDRINALNVEKANTRVAEQAKLTAQAQADANKILATTVSNDPNVITNNCITSSLAKNLPVQGCWPLPAGGLTIATPGGK